MKNFLFAPSLIQERIFPLGCARCGKNLFHAEETVYGLCRECMNAFLAVFVSGEQRCAICGKPLVSETGTCMVCRRADEKKLPRWFDRVLTLFPYRGDYQKILRAYKFGSHRTLGRFFAGCFVRGYKLLVPECPGAGQALWVPVPPRAGKIRETGWDQVEYIARFLEKKDQKTGAVPISRCLKRLRSGTQKTLDRERRMHNLEGKILPAQKRGIPETALVFDDVYTTGSTINACASALKEHGTKNVYGICLFYN